MGNWFSDCFTYKEKASDRRIRDEEEGEENKHHGHDEQRNRISHHSNNSSDAPVDRISGDLSDGLSEGKENKHHEEQSSTPSSDRISDLPDDILHLILSFLPAFKAVGQTSVLSRRWGHVWSSYPILDFYDIFTGIEAIHHQTRARIINRVLARHDENYNICHKITLPRGLSQFQRVRGDANSLCLARVEKLVLDISLSSDNTSGFPRCQLKSHSLKSSSCGNSTAWLSFPSYYIVWSYLLSLQNLSLENVDFRDGAHGTNLFSGFSFPFLRKLSIRNCRGITALKICCPNLTDLWISRMDLYSMDISAMRLWWLYCFANSIHGWVNIFAPNLQFLDWTNNINEKCSIKSFPAAKEFRMGVFPRFGITTTKNYQRCVIDLLSHSSQAEILDLSIDYLEILSDIYFQFGGLPFSFEKLETLKICFSRRKQRCLRGLACLLKSSPVVHTVDIYWYLYSEENDKWNNNLLKTQAQYLNPFLVCLKVVNIYLGPIISENAVTFVKLLLQHGRGLEKIVLKFWRRKSSQLPPNSLDDIIALLKGLPRASANVKISTTVCIN